MTDIIGSKVDVLAVTPGITPEQPILLTVGFQYEGKRVVVVKGLSLTEADALGAQLNWSIMDWTETRREGGQVQ